jgi:Ser/Thr protein kinase RdoA (MazF antagonist)
MYRHSHGDYHFGNILFDKEGKIQGLIDWECARYEPRILSLILAPIVAGMLNRTLDVPKTKAEQDDFLTKRLFPMIAGYNSNKSAPNFSIEELFLLPKFFECCFLGRAYFYLQTNIGKTKDRLAQIAMIRETFKNPKWTQFCRNYTTI